VILVLDPSADPATIERAVARAGALGWTCAVSRGEEQVVVALEGDGDPAALEAAFADDPALDVVPILSREDYQKLRTRRRLMTGLAGGFGLLTAMGAGYPVIGFLLPPKGFLGEGDVQRVASVEELEGRPAKRVNVFGKPMLVIRLDRGRYVAVSAICTHMSICQLEWHEDRRRLVCPCHGGEFDVHGNVVHGPPSIPLPTRQVEELGGELYLRKEA
jgi:cytochrome b6-f complex iron-sulfur subunit